MKKILWWCAGANLELLSKASHNDKQRYLAIGATVIITSIIATFSAYYAFNFLTDNEISSIILALMWGILVTTLNRLVFTYVRRKDASSSNIVSIVPQIIIATFLSFTLAYPIQIKIFDNSIDEIIYHDKMNLLLKLEANYRVIIENKTKEKKILEDRYLSELTGNGPTGTFGKGPVAQALRQRIESQENSIVTLQVELSKQRQEILERKTGIIGRIEALSKLLTENNLAKYTYFIVLIFFLLLEIFPIIIKLYNPKSSYDLLLERSEYLYTFAEDNKGSSGPTVNSENSSNVRSYFEIYCNKILHDLEFQTNRNISRSTELLKTGIIIIISGILGYIGVTYFLVGVFLETRDFKPQYIYFMISLSLLFIFVQFLGGWFLKQYRRTVNTSLYLNTLKPNIDRYLLSYYAICEFANEEERKNLLKEILLIISNEFKNIDSQLLSLQEENFAKEVIDSINMLKDTIANLVSKLK